MKLRAALGNCKIRAKHLKGFVFKIFGMFFLKKLEGNLNLLFIFKFFFNLLNLKI